MLELQKMFETKQEIICICSSKIRLNDVRVSCNCSNRLIFQYLLGNGYLDFYIYFDEFDIRIQHDMSYGHESLNVHISKGYLKFYASQDNPFIIEDFLDFNRLRSKVEMIELYA